MSKQGNPSVEVATGSAKNLKVTVVVSSWNEDITEALLDNALKAAKKAGAIVDVIRVVGALEIPVVVKAATSLSEAVVALGCVIKGGTPHFDYVCDSVTYGLTKISIEQDTPIGNGILTCNTHEQAVDRSGVEGSAENKGADAMNAAIHTALLLREL